MHHSVILRMHSNVTQPRNFYTITQIYAIINFTQSRNFYAIAQVLRTSIKVRNFLKSRNSLKHKEPV
jgi:hypothetical protein